jgi:hypothetical protein
LKDGVSYFPKDTDFYADDKVRILRAEFGAKGMYLLDYLLCDLYGKKGYYTRWNDSRCLLVSDGAAYGCDSNFVQEFVSGCLRCSFFDERVFNAFGILTSAGIQRRYIRMFNSREKVNIIEEYWLLDSADTKDVPTSVLDKLSFKKVFCTENPDKTTENPFKSTGNAQNKVKESNPPLPPMGEAAAPLGETMEYQRALDLFKQKCPSLPAPRGLTDSRRKAIRSAGNILKSNDMRFTQFFERVEASDFLTGRDEQNWHNCGFDWILKPTNLQKIIEGNYDNDRNKKQEGGGSGWKTV